MTFSPLVKQVVSVAGDEDRKNINYTQLELALREAWQKKYWLKMRPKVIVDWEQDANTAPSWNWKSAGSSTAAGAPG